LNEKAMIAVLSDIHGNVHALEAACEDIRRRGIDTVVNLGDCLYGPFDPRPVAERLIEERWPTVSGNGDRCLVESRCGATTSRTVRFTVERLSDRHIS
jgi:predicted phosphodiesterase